jgi:hypothetical protein
MTLHCLLVSFISCYCSHSCSGYQTGRFMKAPGGPYGVPHRHGVSLMAALQGDPEGPPPAGYAGRGGAQ